MPGIGDRAWLLSGDCTLVVLAGRVTVKLDLAGVPPPAWAAALIPLARIAATQLAATQLL